MTEKTTFSDRRKEGLARSLWLTATLLSLPILSFSQGTMGTFDLPSPEEPQPEVPEVQGQPVQRSEADPSEPCYDFSGLEVVRHIRGVPIYRQKEDSDRGELIFHYWSIEFTGQGKELLKHDRKKMKHKDYQDPEISHLMPSFIDDQGRGFKIDGLTLINDGSIDQSNCGRPIWHLWGEDGKPSLDKPIYLNADGFPYVFGEGRMPQAEDTGSRRYHQPQLEGKAFITLIGPDPGLEDGIIYLISPGGLYFSLAGWEYNFLPPRWIMREDQGCIPSTSNFPWDLLPGDKVIYGYEKTRTEFTLFKVTKKCPGLGWCNFEARPDPHYHVPDSTVWKWVRAFSEGGSNLFCH